MFILWVYIALDRTPNIDCYWGGAVPKVNPRCSTSIPSLVPRPSSSSATRGEARRMCLGSKLRALGLGFCVHGSGFRVEGFRVLGLGFLGLELGFQQSGGSCKILNPKLGVNSRASGAWELRCRAKGT